MQHLEALNRGVGRLQRLEAPDRSDQLLQLAVIRLNDGVEAFDLPMQRLLGALALPLQRRRAN